MKNDSLLRWITMGISIVLVSFAQADERYIVREKRPNATVILPEHPSETEIFAAQELVTYITKMSHAVLPQQNESKGHHNSSPVHIFIGGTEDANRRGIVIKNVDVADDAFTIVSFDDRLYIRGKGDRGTLYGVYEFLESLGIRWLMPGDTGEVVPRNTTIALKKYQVTQMPAIRFRRFMRLSTPKELRTPNSLWQLRMRLNSGLPKKYHKKMGGTIGDGPLSHNYRRLIEKDSYKQHPEYFALIDGTRKDPRKTKQYWKMCLSNESVIRTAQENTLNYLRRHPNIDFFSLGPNDGNYWCECDNCRQLQDNHTNQSGPVFYFAKHIIESVGAKYPDIGFPVLSYGKYRLPPKGYQPPNGLVVNITIGGDFSKSITDPSNARARQSFEAWKNLGVPIWAYLYTTKMGFRQMPWPLFRNTVENIRYSQKMGAIGVIGEGYGTNWGPNGLQYYMAAKALWDPHMNIEEVYEDYLRTGFGPAAEAIKGYYETYWQAVKNKGVPLKRMDGARGSSIFQRAIDIYTPDVLAQARRYLDQAYLLAKNRPKVCKRIDLLEVTQSYTEKFIPFAAANKEWRKKTLRKKQVTRERLKLAEDLIAYLDSVKDKAPMAIVYDMKNPLSAYAMPRRAIRRSLLPDIIERRLPSID